MLGTPSGYPHMTRGRYFAVHSLAVPFALACLAFLSWRLGLDRLIALQFFDEAKHVFPGNSNRMLDRIAHNYLLILPILMAVVAGVLALLSWRIAALRQWRMPLFAVVATCALGPAVINLLKHVTAMPRPWAITEYGGWRAMPDVFWAGNGVKSGGALPSNHAGAGYSVLVLYFLGWAMGRPLLRWGGLAVGITSGLVFSFVRIVQGAHFFSQTVCSALVMWLLASLIFAPLILQLQWRRQGQGADASRRRVPVSM